jgi:hypothetical protein
VSGRLIVEQLGAETLVYDTERHRAHALSGAGAVEFAAAKDDVSRREVLRRLALAGAGAAGAGALIRTMVAPTAAQAQSVCGGAGQPCCPSGQNLCPNTTCAVNCIAVCSLIGGQGTPTCGCAC